MKTEYPNCWEFRDGHLHSVADPIEGDGDLDQAIFASGYFKEISSTFSGDPTGAEVSLYKNHTPDNGKPLFYIDVMGAFEDIGAVIAKDFSQLATTLNHLAGILALVKLDQAASIGSSTIETRTPRP